MEDWLSLVVTCSISCPRQTGPLPLSRVAAISGDQSFTHSTHSQHDNLRFLPLTLSTLAPPFPTGSVRPLSRTATPPTCLPHGTCATRQSGSLGPTRSTCLLSTACLLSHLLH